MKKVIGKSIFFVAVLLASFLILEMAMNQGNTDMTSEMAKASYPLVSISMDGGAVNYLHGYAEEMSAAYMRDTITPIGTDRKITIQMDKFGEPVQKLSYEVRSADGSRLIENHDLKDIQTTKDQITASFTIKDLITAGNEYNLILMAQLSSGQSVRYYTRLLEQKDYHVAEKLAFVRKFHEETFDPELAAKDLVSYLEPDNTGDNSSYQTVTIHSSLKQVTWGDLKVKAYGEPQVNIREMMRDTGVFQISFLVTTGSGKNTVYYQVEEYYRIRYTNDRIYLLDYRRTMDQLFDETASVYSGKTIALGIQKPSDVSVTECDGGGIFAFVTGNRLFSYNVADNKMALLFGFYDKQNFDARTLYRKCSIHVLNVEESGNVQFAVCGYMNRGRHEGSVGVQINRYNSVENTVEEQVFIPYTASPDILEKSVEDLIYADHEDHLYLMLDTSIYKVNLTDHTYQTIVQGLQENGYQASADGRMLAWSNGKENSSTQLINMDLATGKKTTINAPSGDCIKPLGFIENDLVYGLAKSSQIRTNSNGRVDFPMYLVKIQDKEGKVLKEYQNSGVYIMSCEVGINQITLHRSTYDAATGVYTVTDDDQIMDSEDVAEPKNVVEAVQSTEYETVSQILLKSEINARSVRLLTPKEVLFEGENEVTPSDGKTATDRFYVYTPYGLSSIDTDSAKAVSEAYDTSGVVLNDHGNYVWYKGNLVTKNQIMKITGTMQSDTKSAMAVCLDTILSFEGVSRNSQYMLDSGKTAPEILQENVQNIQVLNLTGCSLDAMYFYVNQDIPVLVTMNDGSAVLLIGFNDTEVVLMDPSDGTVHKITKKEAETLFSASGNNFITYVRTEE